ncbi:phosphatase PAP2 family protein [Variovorax ginsengisoli]|uniref:Phosphatase PAP2 family protein n=1 Tax=Variovorax ginsengisoli TaxID=363844 RepID=A0ABT8SAN2_9BURK|nr:phosphatase PAP2 family protein [Variovorax ginsengisoli]MDN8616077.1 phosphatase PAP2 family protein [Variovorax ginsengisoli]MDO1535247.1 phosphatase PAP2 family protein [Variovorax ginsengisoli]
MELLKGLSFSQTANSMTLKSGEAKLVTLGRPDKSFFHEQLGLVQSWAELRDERANEILAQIDNQYAFIGAVTGLNMGRHKWTMEWLSMALQLIIPVEMAFKHAFGCYRPVDFSPQVQPIITTPGHGTYPMGHAAQAYALVVALENLTGFTDETKDVGLQLSRQAERISVNRVVAGVHFPVDAFAGAVLGRTLGEYFLRLSGLQTTCLERKFETESVADKAATLDFPGDGLHRDWSTFAKVAEVKSVKTSEFLSAIAKLAQAEWGDPNPKAQS